MSVRWTRDDRGLVIHQKGRPLIRLLGLPFLAAAGVLGWHFVAGIQLAVFDPNEGTPARELAMEAAGVLGVSFADDIDKGPSGPSDQDEDEDTDGDDAAT